MNMKKTIVFKLLLAEAPLLDKVWNVKSITNVRQAEVVVDSFNVPAGVSTGGVSREWIHWSGLKLTVNFAETILQTLRVACGKEVLSLCSRESLETFSSANGAACPFGMA